MVGRFSNGGDTIVARRTVGHDTGMIEHRTSKGRGVMTHSAIFTGSNMQCRLACGISAIVAGDAITADTCVIECRGTECRSGMAEVTVLRGRYMVHCGSLASGIDPVMTPGAVVGHARVIENASGKAAGVMTYTTILSGGDVVKGFTRSV